MQILRQQIWGGIPGDTCAAGPWARLSSKASESGNLLFYPSRLAFHFRNLWLCNFFLSILMVFWSKYQIVETSQEVILPHYKVQIKAFCMEMSKMGNRICNGQELLIHKCYLAYRAWYSGKSPGLDVRRPGFISWLCAFATVISLRFSLVLSCQIKEMVYMASKNLFSSDTWGIYKGEPIPAGRDQKEGVPSHMKLPRITNMWYNNGGIFPSSAQTQKCYWSARLGNLPGMKS